MYNISARNLIRTLSNIHPVSPSVQNQLFACWVILHVFLSSADFFQKYHQSVKQFGSRSGPTLCWAWSGSKLFANDICLLSADDNSRQRIKLTSNSIKLKFCNYSTSILKDFPKQNLGSYNWPIPKNELEIVLVKPCTPNHMLINRAGTLSLTRAITLVIFSEIP